MSITPSDPPPLSFLPGDLWIYRDQEHADSRGCYHSIQYFTKILKLMVRNPQTYLFSKKHFKMEIKMGKLALFL